MMSDSKPTDSYIDPKRLISDMSIEELNHYSDEYYKNLVLKEFQMGKPFATPVETPRLLLSLGFILEELRLGPGSRVLDFGSGTCWIAKALWQMGCEVTAVDVSQTALDLGKELFEKYPIPMRKNGDWHLKRFDGHRLPLGNNSVDRIICYDTFHHVPNQETVIQEFYRVLDDGGVIALSEPIGEHSKTQASQREMRDYKVLENDLDIMELTQEFLTAGFGEPQFKLQPSPDLRLDLPSWNKLRQGKISEDTIQSFQRHACGSAIFTFQKGNTKLDSRNVEGLAHNILCDRTSLDLKANEPEWLNLQVSNTGKATWLHGSGATTGVVNVGTQFIDVDSGAQTGEHARFHFDRDIEPGESIEMKVQIILRERGHFQLRLDLVSELVCWFHQCGSDAVILDCYVD